MRTYGDLQMSLMRSLGADPTQLSWSELYSALQTGAVDGNMNGYQTLYSGSLHEVQPVSYTHLPPSMMTDGSFVMEAVM